MTVWQALDAYLAQAFSLDYWSDEAILYAFELVQHITPTDWKALRSSWRVRPASWQLRCAEILSQATPQQAVLVLLDVIQTPDDELAVMAAEALRVLPVDDLKGQVSLAVIRVLPSSVLQIFWRW